MFSRDHFRLFRKAIAHLFPIQVVFLFFTLQAQIAQSSEQLGTADGIQQLAQLNEFIVELWDRGELDEAITNAEIAYSQARNLRADGDERNTVLLLRGTTASNLGRLYVLLGNFKKSEALIQESIDSLKLAGREDSFDMATTLMNYGARLNNMGRYAESEKYLKQSVDIFESEKYRNVTSPFILQIKSVGMTHLAYVYNNLNREGEAEHFFERAYRIGKDVHEAILDASGGKEGYIQLINTMSTLALHKLSLGKNDESVGLLDSALSLSQKYNHQHLYYRPLLEAFAVLHLTQGQLREAHGYFEKMLVESNTTFGTDSIYSLDSKRLIGQSHLNQGEYEEAENILKEVKTALERTVGQDHYSLIPTLIALGDLFAVLDRTNEAVFYYDRALGLSTHRNQVHLRQLNTSLLGRENNKFDSSELLFKYLAAADSMKKLEPSHGLAARTLQFAQQSLTTTVASSINKMSSRVASQEYKLSAVVRQRQEAWATWSVLDQKLQLARAKKDIERDFEIEDSLSKKIEIESKTISDLDFKINSQFENFEKFAVPAPVSQDELQNRLLSNNEAMILILTPQDSVSTNESPYIWIVTKTDIKWFKSKKSVNEINSNVAALRCGLDRSGWEGKAEKCAEVTGIDLGLAPQEGDPLPFNVNKAYELYDWLLGEHYELLVGLDLILVPTGSLSQIPLQILVTNKPAPETVDKKDFSSVSWLILEHEISVLPAIGTLRALRNQATTAIAPQPLVGFGNPLLDGLESDAEMAKTAREISNCETIGPLPTLAAVTKGITATTDLLEKNGLARIDVILKQKPLPNTARELCTVASFMQAGASDIYLGENATEKSIKQLNDVGKLKDYRILHFATHGAVAGELGDLSEPGLIFTPPEEPTEIDDGYLTATEIAAFDLNAQLVILSACNTASGTGTNTEALSGMASSFFYSGARSILVSHWYVNTEAAEEIIVNLFSGRGSLQASVVGFINENGYKSHPSYWAPFVLVGDRQNLEGSIREERGESNEVQ